MNFGLNPIISRVEKMNAFSIRSKTSLAFLDGFTAEALFNATEENTYNNFGNYQLHIYSL